jgi:signal transduction histidine kinase
VVSELQPVALRPESELTVYRLIQESLTNISKHARAHTVRVTLGQHDDRVEVEVSDDGVGFDLSAQKFAAHGLLGMRYRVEAEGGTLRLQAAPGQGTSVVARLPLAAAAA